MVHHILLKEKFLVVIFDYNNDSRNFILDHL